MAAVEVGEPVPAELAGATVLARDGGERTFGELWSGGPTVVVFLRHFACVGCSEHVAILSPRLPELARLGVRVVMVGNGAPHYIDGFIQRNFINPEDVEIVTDPTLAVFAAAGLHRSFWATYGPTGMKNVARALLAGFRQSGIEGDSYQQGGVIVIDGTGRVAFVHRDRVLGDHSSPEDMIDAAMRVVARTAAIV